MGNTGKGVPPWFAKAFYKGYSLVNHMDRSFHKMVERHGYTHHLAVYPIINLLMPMAKTVTVGTDSVLEPSGWLPHRRLMVETEVAKEIMHKVWGKRYDKNVTVTGGFPAPVKGLMLSQYLGEKRAEKLMGGEPLTVLLPASGVATAQLAAFKVVIGELAVALDEGKVRVVVQCGTNTLGEIVKGELTEQIKELETEFPKIWENIVLHHSEKTMGALDFFEVLAGSKMPMVMAVKGSEMARMAVALGIPHIALGTIGDHEKWNVIWSAIQGAPVFIVHSSYSQVKEFIKSKHFPPVLRAIADEAVERAKCESIVEAVERAREAILSKTRVGTNRQMMLQTLQYLLSL